MAELLKDNIESEEAMSSCRRGRESSLIPHSLHGRRELPDMHDELAALLQPFRSSGECGVPREGKGPVGIPGRHDWGASALWGEGLADV